MKRSRISRAAACILAAAFLFCCASCSARRSDDDTTTQTALFAEITESLTATEACAIEDDFAQPDDITETGLFSLSDDASMEAGTQTTAEAQTTVPAVTTEPMQTTLPPTTQPPATTTTTTLPTTTAHIHSYHTTVSPATCTDRGYVVKTCECGDRKMEYTDEALGHDFSAFDVEKEASPTETGKKVRTCARCGIQESEDIPKIRPYISAQAAQEMLRLVNEDRARASLGALTYNSALYPCAEIRAKEIGTNYSHTRPNGQAWYTVIDEQGFQRNVSCGENIYNPYGDSVSAADAEAAFMNSAGHRSNILNPAYKSVSICVLYTEERTYFVQLFFG